MLMHQWKGKKQAWTDGEFHQRDAKYNKEWNRNARNKVYDITDEELLQPVHK